MLPVEKKVFRPRETIIEWKPKKTKTRENIIKRTTTAKTFKKWMEANIKLLHNDKKIELEQVMKAVLEKYNQYEEHEKVVLESWKGNSGLEFIKTPKGFTVVRHQKKEKDGKPEQILDELDNMEVNLIIKALNELTESTENKQKWIFTRELGEHAYKVDWDAEIFSNRKLHHKLTYILNLLEKYGFIEYSRSGKSRLTKDIKSVETLRNHGKN